MNIFLWTLQVLLALHTAMGAIWKFSHSAEQTMPSLKAIPNGMWMAMMGVELLCAVGLVLPALNSSWGILISISAVVILIEMLVFCGLHFASGNAASVGPLIYWLIVAALCVFVAYGRYALSPLE